MANQEQLQRLKRSVQEWNAWRNKHPEEKIDLRGTDLIGADLKGADLSVAKLNNANLSGANLSSADFRQADFTEANLSGTEPGLDIGSANFYQADFTEANLNGANLRGATFTEAYLGRASLVNANLDEADFSNASLVEANLGNTYLSRANFYKTYLYKADLSGVDLSSAKLNNANFTKASLSGANLRGANLSSANFYGADLYEANFSSAILGDADMSYASFSQTTFVDNDFRLVKGLIATAHWGRSYIDLYSVQLPKDGSGQHFLRGAGIPDEWIDFYRVQVMHPIQYQPVFISYASHDELLAQRLYADLQAHGVRCWFAPHDMKTGDKIRERIDEAIHLHEKLLLILSEHALTSDWVEAEVAAALEKEQQQQRLVLFPVRIDEEVMRTTRAWAALLRRTRHIGDLTRWSDSHTYQHAFECLLLDLKNTQS